MVVLGFSRVTEFIKCLYILEELIVIQLTQQWIGGPEI